jgi:hypothetical protein
MAISDQVDANGKEKVFLQDQSMCALSGAKQALNKGHVIPKAVSQELFGG